MWAQAPVPVIDARQSAWTNRQIRCPDDRTPILNSLPRPGEFCHITGKHPFPGVPISLWASAWR
jgi:hypothetical protein